MKKKLKGVVTETGRKIPHHDCVLPLEDEPTNYRIFEGCCVQFRRIVWDWVTVSQSDPNSKKYLKSATQIHLERIRHLMHFPWTIHPFSKGRFAWEMIMLPVWLSLYIIIPIEISRPFHPSYFMIYLKLTLDITCWVDIIMWFFTGYYDQERQIVILKHTKIAKRYICSYFLFDILSCQPIKFYITFRYRETQYYFMIAVLLLKAVRLLTVIKYMHKFAERTGIFESNIKFVCFTLIIVIIMLWTTCIIYMMMKILGPMPVLKYTTRQVPMLKTTFRVTRYLMGLGVTDKVNTSNCVMLLETTLITLGAVLGVIILARVMVVYQRISSSRNKYNNLLEQIGEYMSYKELPLRVREKIMNYIDFKFQKHIFREEDILNNLSSVLKHDILLQRCQRMVERVDIFKNLPSEAMVRIVTKLRSVIYLPNDVIVLAGYAGNSMFFIYTGTVAVYTTTGKEICHLNDGDSFGEIALLINEPRVATVIAVKECELFKLSRKDFQEAIEPFPEISKKIRHMALNRLENTLQMLYDEGMDVNKNEDSKSDAVEVDIDI